MNYTEIKLSKDQTHFLFEGNPVFDKVFIEALKFHSPGIAPVLDNSGAYHIDSEGNELYKDRYSRTFGYYCNRAAVFIGNQWFHIDEKGKKVYDQKFAWTGNFQENLCSVRDFENKYFHIDLNGNSIYDEKFMYVGDFKDGFACVKKSNGRFIHIDSNGKLLNSKEFIDLGVFHKGFATAKDENGWFHIDKKGLERYSERYLLVEPFYNGFAVVTKFDNSKLIINEYGNVILGI